MSAAREKRKKNGPGWGSDLADFAWGHCFVLLDANADWGWSYPTDAMERCWMGSLDSFVWSVWNAWSPKARNQTSRQSSGGSE